MFGRLHRCFGSAIRLGPIRRGSDVLELVFLCKCLECLRGKLCSIISNECMRYSMTAEVFFFFNFFFHFVFLNYILSFTKT